MTRSNSWTNTSGNSINPSIFSSSKIVHEMNRVFLRQEPIHPSLQTTKTTRIDVLRISFVSHLDPHRRPTSYQRWSNSSGRVLSKEHHHWVCRWLLHRFIESFNLSTMIHLLENSTKMMNLAMQYARHQPPAAMSSANMEDWRIHVKVDYTRLQTLLDHDMCAPLVWIEHLQHLLDGNRCQLFDCDYMFNVLDFDPNQQRAQWFY